MILIVPLLILGQRTMRTYDEARVIQQAAMIGRRSMEESRGQGDLSLSSTVAQGGKEYAVTVQTYPAGAYRCYEVTVEDCYGRIFRCKRLEKA